MLDPPHHLSSPLLVWTLDIGDWILFGACLPAGRQGIWLFLPAGRRGDLIRCAAANKSGTNLEV
jgi:hypothetical protein